MLENEANGAGTGGTGTVAPADDVAAFPAAGDATPPRPRRRRAASRPAGPPQVVAADPVEPALAVEPPPEPTPESPDGSAPAVTAEADGAPAEA
ncbi:MAG: hypothetical protein M3P96_03165, partial [Actinomycetota bacterium]|nr:hypothetical protein [Actinomycetota bacterium]